MAAPFVEGRLRGNPLAVTIATACAHCDAAMTIRVDSELRYEVQSPGAAPMVFEPRIDWTAFAEENIIRQY